MVEVLASITMAFTIQLYKCVKSTFTPSTDTLLYVKHILIKQKVNMKSKKH